MAFVETENQKSKYNEAASSLGRIGNLLQSCHYWKKRGNLIQWNITLDCIWTELAADADKDDPKKFSNFIKLQIKYAKDKIKLYQILLQKEIFLRKLQNNQGKGTAYLDPDSDMM